MVRLTLVSLSTALLLAVASPLVPALPLDATNPVTVPAAPAVPATAPPAAPQPAAPAVPLENMAPSEKRATTPPEASTLVQFKGCRNSEYTIPMFVNKNYPVSGPSFASTVWVVMHGAGRNFQDYFKSIHDVIGDEGVIIAPNFYASGDEATWYDPLKNLAWKKERLVCWRGCCRSGWRP